MQLEIRGTGPDGVRRTWKAFEISEETTWRRQTMIFVDPVTNQHVSKVGLSLRIAGEFERAKKAGWL